MFDDTEYAKPTASQDPQGPVPCYFMVVDILGFSEIINNLDGEDQSQRIADWLSLVETTQHETNVKQTQLISDTLFVREEDSIEGLSRLLRFAQLLLERGLEMNFPLRGSIVHGDAAWGHLTYGKAVMDAHTMERSLDWIGIACSPDLPDLNGLWGWDTVVRYPVPRKVGDLEILGAVTWEVPELPQLFLLATDSGLVDEDENASWGVVAKLERTNQFGTYLRIGRLAGTNPGLSPGYFPMQIIDPLLRTLRFMSTES